MARLQQYLARDYIKNSPFKDDLFDPRYDEPSKGGGPPGFHAEVLAVNDALLRYFPGSKDLGDLNRITECTLALSGAKKKKAFPTCGNCKAILWDHVRIPTNLKPKRSQLAG